MNQNNYIPFNKPYVAPNAIKYVEEALNSNHQQGGGPFNKKAAALVQKINGGGEVFLTSSCTQALEMATILLDLKPGDEVIMPSYTFTSAAIALVNFGIVPVFVDVDPIHLNIDPIKVREAITPKTKAISIVNYAGYACNFSELDLIAHEHNLLKIEDNAHGFGATSCGYRLGTWGDVATLSFHATKNVQCGEGGALVVNNTRFIERAYVLQEKGTDRKKFLEGSIAKYQWVDKGGSYLMPEVVSAYLLAQLESYDEIQNGRRLIWQKYFDMFVGNKSNLNIFINESEFTDAAHMFYIIFNDSLSKEKFLEKSKQHGFTCTFHYQNLAKSIFGEKFSSSQNHPVSDHASHHLVRMPLWHTMDVELQENTLKKLLERML